MMNRNYYLFLFFFLIPLLFTSCELTKNCYDCFTPPEELRLKITDKIDSTDLLYSGFYNRDSIFIFYYDNENKKNIEFSIYIDSINQKAFIYSYEIAWKSVEGFKDFFLYLNSAETDTIYLNVEEDHSDRCCTFFSYRKFSINNEIIEKDLSDFVYNFKK